MYGLGVVRVQPTFQSTSQPNLFAVGDAMRLPVGRELPKTWMTTRQQAPLVAQNLVAQARGQGLSDIDVEKARKRGGLAMPDCGGKTVMVRVKNGRVLASGRWPLLLCAMVDRHYLKARR